MTINWKKILFGISDEKLDPYFHLERTEEYKLVEVKAALAKAELPEVLHLLSTLPSAAIEPHVIALSARYHRLEEEQLQGILNYQDYQIGLNRLSSDILKLLQLLEKTFQPESIIQEVKANLRQLYLQRLQDKLADRHPINIQCAYSLTGTDWDRAQIAYDDIVLEQKEVSTSLERIFDEHRGRLLVIGEPGAGKTSLLLQLADALLQRRENRVPVILNLATWNDTYKNFEHWLLETLPRAGSLSKAYAKTLVLEDRLLPLFDGLDEVKAEHRQACLDAIAQYGQVAEHQYVICSRTREYAEIGEAPVYAQIELQPLKAEQIRAELENSAQPEAKFLLHAIEQDPLLAEVVRNPFYFNTTQLLLASMKSYTSLGIQASTVEELQGALVEKFVAQQLNTTVKTAFPAEKSRKWLGFMAKKMEENGLVVFELVDLNLGWLERKWVYYLLGISWFLVSGTVGYVIAGGPIILISIILLIIWSIISPNRIKERGTLYWSPIALKSKVLKNIVLGFCFWAIGMAILFSQIYYVEKLAPLNLSEEAFMLIPFPFFFLSLHYFFAKRSLILILAFSLVVVGSFVPNWVVFLLFISLVIFANGLDRKGYNQKTKRYDSIFNSLSIWVIFFITFTSLSTYYDIYILKETTYLIDIFIDLLFPLQLTLFFSFGRFILILFTLQMPKKIPLNLLSFLREMDARHIFESPGGSWRFRHKILQDYFIQEHERMERERVLPN
jgi:Effector-associated domain 11/NACHT domain